MSLNYLMFFVRSHFLDNATSYANTPSLTIAHLKSDLNNLFFYMIVLETNQILVANKVIFSWVNLKKR